MPVGLERLTTMAEKDKKNNKKLTGEITGKSLLKDEKKRMKELYESRQTPYERKEAKRTEDNVKAVMEGLNVSKEEAEKIVRDTLFRGKRRLKADSGKSQIMDFGTKEEQKERSKKLRRQKKLQTGKEVNKGGLLKMKSGGKVYSRGSRKANYNG